MPLGRLPDDSSAPSEAMAMAGEGVCVSGLWWRAAERTADSAYEWGRAS